MKSTSPLRPSVRLRVGRQVKKEVIFPTRWHAPSAAQSAFPVLTCPAPLQSPAMPPSPSASSPLPLLTGMPGSPAEAPLVLVLEVGASTLSATLFEVNGLHVVHVEVVEWEKVRPHPCSSGEWTLIRCTSSRLTPRRCMQTRQTCLPLLRAKGRQARGGLKRTATAAPPSSLRSSGPWIVSSSTWKPLARLCLAESRRSLAQR